MVHCLFAGSVWGMLHAVHACLLPNAVAMLRGAHPLAFEDASAATRSAKVAGGLHAVQFLVDAQRAGAR